jgi:hypothetical protein
MTLLTIAIILLGIAQTIQVCHNHISTKRLAALEAKASARPSPGIINITVPDEASAHAYFSAARFEARRHTRTQGGGQ